MFDLTLYALSTCIWCRKTEKLLSEMGFKYTVHYVDTLEGKDREQAMKEVERFNPSRSFPTLIVNGQKVVIGYKPDEIRGVLMK
jgi:glutaredoxin-like protein NrdH